MYQISVTMSRMILTLLIISCILGLAVAQYGQLGAFRHYSEWLMDDPQKANRMPFWNHLLGNRRFMTGSRGRTSTRARAGSGSTGWNSFSGNMNWMPLLMTVNFDY
ncbi:uncharacterized protein LOC123527385 [Mercenaria mercenaria]|uniref:uncharacterized protein LOC123527385 n=1 Tax=Mercenaria mercenaria TaxID=6596 RepID=UPI00234F0273|nr:uncharacterized protein LOC123527385 [Mercenaria mercenaria]